MNCTQSLGKAFMLISASLMGSVFPLAVQAQSADLVLTNAQVFTPSGWEQAIAVRDGVIVGLGDTSSMEEHTGPGTQVVDLHGSTVLPGLHDLHVHPLGAGLAQFQCNFQQGSGKDAVLSTVAECAANRTEGEWITGGQWDAASFGDELHRRMLDEAAPKNPVSLVDISGHSIWVNSRALELAGIDNDTLNPPGGVIERNAAGEITGVLRESAAGLVRGIIPPESPARVKQALRWSADLMLSHGITSFTDAGVTGASMRAYAELADEGKLKQRIRLCMMWSGAAFGGGSGGTPDYIAQRNIHARDRLSPDCIKIALDGVPTDGHTAAMVEPYEDAGGSGREEDRGLLMVSEEDLEMLVTQWDAMGFAVKMHTAGDRAVRAGLDAIEAARQANGFSGNLHSVAHNSFVQMSDIRRARGMGATFEMSPYIWYPNPIIPDIRKAVGEERMQRWIPVRDAIEAGALVVPGSDWPVVPLVNPWLGMETLVTRRAPGGVGQVLGESQKISLEQAVEMFTVSAARQLGQRHQVGSIAPGMLADLVVVGSNPFDMPITDVHDMKVLMTFIEGELVYQAD